MCRTISWLRILKIYTFNQLIHFFIKTLPKYYTEIKTPLRTVVLNSIYYPFYYVLKYEKWLKKSITSSIKLQLNQLYAEEIIKPILEKNVYSFAKKTGHTWLFELLS